MTTPHIYAKITDMNFTKAEVRERHAFVDASVEHALDASEAERTDPYAEATPLTFARADLIGGWNWLSEFFDRVYIENGISLDKLWGSPDNNPEYWTRHFVMCSTDLANQAAKIQPCQIVNSYLQEKEAMLEEYHSRQLDRNQAQADVDK